VRQILVVCFNFFFQVLSPLAVMKVNFSTTKLQSQQPPAASAAPEISSIKIYL